MPAFVAVGDSVHADWVHFFKVNNWGFYTGEQVREMDVYDSENPHHGEFVSLLRSPCFHRETVVVDNIDNFITDSDGAKAERTEGL
jgi:hypothetical protein